MQRINVYGKGQRAMAPLFSMGAYLKRSALPQMLLELVYFRVSQINGCAYCLDMHSKDLRAKGETEQRLYVLDAWRDTDLYTDQERAALGWAEAVTRISNGVVPDDVYAAARKQFSEEELIDLTLAVTTINTYNRINIAFAVPGGTYEVGMHEAKLN